MQEQLLSAAEAARLLDVHPATMIYWRKSGIGPPWIAIGRRLIRYRQSDLREWIDSRMISPAKAS